MIVIALIAIVAVLGARARKRGWRYWAMCAFAAIYVELIGPYLFYGGGTLETPEQDGVLTRLVRAAVNDGPWMGLWALAVLLLMYGGMAVLLMAAVRDKHN